MKKAQKTVRQRHLPEIDTLSEDIHPLLRRLYLARGVKDAAELERGLGSLLPPENMLNLDQAAGRVASAVQNDESILIVGDFDADGATGTVVGVRALRAMGARYVDYCVPNRFEFGYGLSPGLVESIAQPFPDLVLTVDNGISSIEGTAAAKALGADVVITDHHLPGEELPDAFAIVNPNQYGDEFPSKAIAGVGVMFYLVSQVRRQLTEAGWFTDDRQAPNLASLLDLVALGTVADLVPLDKNNRILVHNGIGRIRQARCVPGILALLTAAKRDHRALSASDLGFAVAPRLNAAGRLEDMSVGIECLLADDIDTAVEYAQRLNEINTQRRTLQEDMQQQAQALTSEITRALQGAELPAGLCLHDHSWHQGIVGLVASRIKDTAHRPVIAFAPENPGASLLKGSARSIPGIHIRDVLAVVDAENPGMINAFGGHAMAAGLSLESDQLEFFEVAFNTALNAVMEPHHLENILMTDGELAPDELDLATAQILRNAGPWGQRYPEPLFEGWFEILDKRIVGEKHLKMTVQAAGSDAIDAIAFFMLPSDLPGEGHRAHFVYRLDVNEFRGRQSVQLMIEHVDSGE